MEKYFFVGIGGFVGSVCRYGLSGLLYRLLGDRFPYGTTDKIEALIPEIDAMIEKAHCGAMMTIEKVDVRKYSAGK